jgi:hypothetical protein
MIIESATAGSDRDKDDADKMVGRSVVPAISKSLVRLEHNRNRKASVPIGFGCSSKIWTLRHAKHAGAITGPEDQVWGRPGRKNDGRAVAGGHGDLRLIAIDFDGPLLLEPQTITAVNDDDAGRKKGAH